LDFSFLFIGCFSFLGQSRKIELHKEQFEELSKSKRIANPGCYPTGFISLTRPLTDAGILPKGTHVTVNAISGYSGGNSNILFVSLRILFTGGPIQKR
jgi:hypothetical protein